MNTKWRFYKLTRLTKIAALLKDVPMGCNNGVLPKPLLRNDGMIQSTVSRMRKIQDNHITITCAVFVRLLSFCMALNDWKKKVQN